MVDQPRSAEVPRRSWARTWRNFLCGASSVLELIPARSAVRLRRSFESGKSDSDALAEDWLKVGNALEECLATYSGGPTESVSSGNVDREIPMSSTLIASNQDSHAAEAAHRKIETIVQAGRETRVIVVCTDERVAGNLRGFLSSIDSVTVVAEVKEPEVLASTFTRSPAEVLLVDLDPNPDRTIKLVEPLLAASTAPIVAIGMTESRDAELAVRAMRAGIREFLWKPFPPEQLREIFDRVVAEPGEREDRSGNLIAVVGAAGGVGTTTVATNLAVELAQLTERGEHAGVSRVCIVDLNLCAGQVATQLDLQPAHSIADLCKIAADIDRAVIERVTVTHETGVRVVAAPTDLLSAAGIDPKQCVAVLRALRQQFDFLVVDCASGFEPVARTALEIADACLLVLQFSVPAVRNADRLLSRLKDTEFNMKNVQLVCNRFDDNRDNLKKDDVEAHFHRKVDFLLPNDWKRSSVAANLGQPLSAYAPRSELRLAYRAMAVAISGTHDRAREEAAASQRSTGREHSRNRR